jgi:ornithine cyclodeaminase/alanine dehydrogenase-like protein (mu-crystallin family)
MTTTLTDAEVRAGLTAADSVATMREAVLAAHRGELVTPARSVTNLGEGRLLFTVGRWRGRWLGYRSYETFDRDHPDARDDQVVVVHDDVTGQLLGIVVGAELGRRRTGALGGVAVDALAPAAAKTLGLVGTGRQAWTQLWAVSAVRKLDTVRVYSRDERRRQEFAERASKELGLATTAAPSAQAAVAEADIVILATNSPEPVIRTHWLAPGCHVSTLGPKQRGRSEFAEDLLESATALVTDSPAQLEAYDPPALAGGDRHASQVASLGAVLAGDAPGRTGDSDRTVYLSVGLAGTEVALAAALLT